MTAHLVRAMFHATRWMSETQDDSQDDNSIYADDDGHVGEDNHGFGVHIEYTDLYDAIIFLCCIYVGGQIANFIKMPNLVGEIVVGILLGPPLANYVPNPEAFVLFGEIGLVLLVIEAGIDVDVSTLKLIGARGFMIAIVGSILPIGLGILIAIAVEGTGDIKAAIAAGATFGPTSVGVALSILRAGGVLNTPVGQLIISAAVIDDMIALVVLSQLESLTETITASTILIPVVSATCFLVGGGYIALFIVPGLVHKYVHPKVSPDQLGKVELALMFGIVLFMLPATYYAKASYLMGSFVAGLAFCTSHDLHVEFVRQLKRVMQWLLRIFFAASIGFQVPIKDFGNVTVIWKGLVFCLALLGKLAVGFMVPNFTQSKRFTENHLRDCLITGFSMAAEGEFAFVIAVYSVGQGLIYPDLYASIVLAVLISTIIPPFLLRFTISYYNDKAQKELERLAKEEMERKHDLDSERLTDGTPDREEELRDEIKNKTAVFLCIQTQSDSLWGLMNSLMSTLSKLGLDVIDHRAWHPRGIDTTLVNEIYAKDVLVVRKGRSSQQALEERMEEVRMAIEKAINRPDDAKVKVQRWFPGVVEELVNEKKTGVARKTKLSLEASLVKEASERLTMKQSVQLLATEAKSVKEILQGLGGSPPADEPGASMAAENTSPITTQTRQPRKRKQKMRSTPVVGGGLFGENTDEEKKDDDFLKKKVSGPGGPMAASIFGMQSSGRRAAITVDGETFDVRLSAATLKKLQNAYSGDMLGLDDSLDIQPHKEVTTMLTGYVRQRMPLSKITEDDDLHSETSSVKGSQVTASESGLPPV